MDNSRVSIIMASYNSAEYIAEAIESVLAQSYQDWELIVCDDASKDNSVAVIERFVEIDSRITLIKLLCNKGAAVARNRALNYAMGRYIAFCDSDDYWAHDKLARQLEFMQRKGARVCYSSYIECSEVGEPQRVVVARKSLTLSDMVGNDYIGFLTLVYDTKELGKVELPELRKRQDWALKLLLLKRVGSALGVLEPLAYYRVRKGSLSSSKWRLMRYNVQVYERVMGYGICRAWAMLLTVFLPRYFFKKVIIKLNNR